MSSTNTNILSTAPNVLNLPSTFDSSAVQIVDLFQANSIKALNALYVYQLLGQTVDPASGKVTTTGLIDNNSNFYPANLTASGNLVAQGNLVVNGTSQFTGALSAGSLTTTGNISTPSLSTTTISSPRWKSTLAINKTSSGPLPQTASYTSSGGSLSVRLEATVQYQGSGLIFTPAVANLVVSYTPQGGSATQLMKVGQYFGTSSTDQKQLCGTGMIASGSYPVGAMSFSVTSDSTNLTMTNNSNLRLVIQELPY